MTDPIPRAECGCEITHANPRVVAIDGRTVEWQCETSMTVDP